MPLPSPPPPPPAPCRHDIDRCIILGLSHTHVNFTRVNKIEAMYGRSRVSVKVERGSTFTFTCGLLYIAPISFMHVNFTWVRMEKLPDSANQPLLSRARRKTQSNTKLERRAQCARLTKGKVTSYRVFRLVFLSYLFSFVNLAPTLRVSVWLFFFFFFFGAT